MTAYYNEFDPYAAQWLRNLIDGNMIVPGDVDDRSIVDVQPEDLKGYVQCHFFAGIAGWPAALRLAGWPDERPAWSGSCPCQPFSCAGQKKGHTDERHLWPAFFHLISQCRPSTFFGEQVASKDGREWFAGVRLDLETLGYACGAADLAACLFGAPHKRSRLFFVADSDLSCKNERPSSRKQSIHEPDIRTGEGMGHATSEPMGQCGQPWQHTETVECEDGLRRVEPGAQPLAYGIPRRLDKIRGYGNAIIPQVAAHFIEAYLEYRP
jgi:DNA (cytosine-5)-methyltransferase 1